MKKLSYLLVFFMLPAIAFGNNIKIDNISISGQNTSASYTLVEFDISWDNSWRINVGPSNWDAAWIFIKYRESGGEWMHGTINYVDGTASNDGHTSPSGSTINTSSDGVGAFIYRSELGSGNVAFDNVRLRWNYGSDGLGDDALVDIKVFAIEMVYVPQGAFKVGTPGTEVGKFHEGAAANKPFTITSEGEIKIGNVAGSLYYDNFGDQTGPVPASFPKGYGGFYIMKYETSQQQWLSFFNSLNTTQKANNDLTDATHKNSDEKLGGNGISYTTGNATTTSPYLPVNYISWTEVNAYLDWTGLRPMTEFEYEKACRGTLDPVAGEFAWGNSNISLVNYTLTNQEKENSLITNVQENMGNANYQNRVGQPTRVGIFAASAINKNREETGGSFYGVMDLSGNVYERVITIGNPEGRSFNGSHGDGEITIDGEANVATWIEGTGGGYRGGGFPNGDIYLRVSDRNDAANISDIKNNRIGFRGVRTAM